MKRVYTGRGGGCAILTNPSLPLNGTLEDCVFEENFARSLGGGLYITFDGQLNHLVVLNRVKLSRNECRLGGGLIVGFAIGSNAENVSSLFAYNSEFVKNQAKFGGGAGLLPAGK